MSLIDRCVSLSYLQNKPAKNTYKVTYDQGARRSLKKLRNTLVHNHYRNDLKQVRSQSIVIQFHRSVHSFMMNFNIMLQTKIAVLILMIQPY